MYRRRDSEGERSYEVKTWVIDISYGNKRMERVFCLSENKPVVEVKELNTEADLGPSLIIIDEYKGGAK